MPAILRESTPVARKPHRCSLCWTRIEPGDQYRTTVYLDPCGDGIYTWRACGACDRDGLAATVWSWADMPCEGIGTDEADAWARETADDPEHGQVARAYLIRRGITLGGA